MQIEESYFVGNELIRTCLFIITFLIA